MKRVPSLIKSLGTSAISLSWSDMVTAGEERRGGSGWEGIEDGVRVGPFGVESGERRPDCGSSPPERALPPADRCQGALS